jgi:hypothetical protein
MSREIVINRLRGDAGMCAACVASALVSRSMGEVMTHQIAVEGWLLWVYVYPDGTSKIVC